MACVVQQMSSESRECPVILDECAIILLSGCKQYSGSRDHDQ